MATRTPRNDAVSQVVADWLAENSVGETALVVDDHPGLISSELRDLDVEVTRWSRMSTDGGTWLPQGKWDRIILRLPKSRDALRMYVHAAAARLADGGSLLVAGANDEGVKSASKRIGEVFAEVSTVETRRRCRIFEARQPSTEVRGDLDAWAVRCDDEDLFWISFPGVFAHGRLDPGTRELLERVEDPDPNKRVLDFGCGSGLVGMKMKQRVPGLSVDLLDVDGLAVEAARRNLPECRVVHSDGWSAVGTERWDLILSNPPFHDGVARNHDVLDRLVRQAPDHLANRGALVLVCQRNVPVRDRLVETFGKTRCERLHLGKYQVWKATKPPPTRRGGRPARR